MWLDFVVTSIVNRLIHCFWMNQILSTLLEKVFHSWKKSEYQVGVVCVDENNNYPKMYFTFNS